MTPVRLLGGVEHPAVRPEDTVAYLVAYLNYLWQQVRILKLFEGAEYEVVQALLQLLSALVLPGLGYGLGHRVRPVIG